MEQNGKIIGKRERIEATFDRYSGEVSREAIIKDDILLHGLNFSERSLKGGAYQEKAYYLFTFDSDRPEVVRERPAMIPQEICIQGGSYGLRRTIIQSRHSKDSPYSVDVLDGKRVLLLDGVPVADVSFVPRPAYYGQELRDGMRVEEVAPSHILGGRDRRRNCIQDMRVLEPRKAVPVLRHQRKLQVMGGHLRKGGAGRHSA